MRANEPGLAGLADRPSSRRGFGADVRFQPESVGGVALTPGADVLTGAGAVAKLEQLAVSQRVPSFEPGEVVRVRREEVLSVVASEIPKGVPDLRAQCCVPIALIRTPADADDLLRWVEPCDLTRAEQIDVPVQRDMFGRELKVGYWVAIPRRDGRLETRPLEPGWYRIEDLRQDDEGDWLIRFFDDRGDRRYHWLLRWDTLPACDSEQRPMLSEMARVHAEDVRPGSWVYVPTPVNGWFEAARYPQLSLSSADRAAKPGEVTIAVFGRDPVVLHRFTTVSVFNLWAYWR